LSPSPPQDTSPDLYPPQSSLSFLLDTCLVTERQSVPLFFSSHNGMAALSGSAGVCYSLFSISLWSYSFVAHPPLLRALYPPPQTAYTFPLSCLQPSFRKAALPFHRGPAVPPYPTDPPPYFLHCLLAVPFANFPPHFCGTSTFSRFASKPLPTFSAARLFRCWSFCGESFTTASRVCHPSALKRRTSNHVGFFSLFPTHPWSGRVP